MEWIFDGIGTEILSFIFGLVTGVVGHKFYINENANPPAMLGRIE